MNASNDITGDCTTLTPGSLRWSKISQAGLITPGGTGTWATDNLIKTNFTSTATIPKNLKAGNYVVRHEIIALHGAQSDNGAQLYPQVRLLLTFLGYFADLPMLAVFELEGNRQRFSRSLWWCCWYQPVQED